jgi:hypothetical protein
MTWSLWWIGFWQMLPYFVVFFVVPVVVLFAIAYRHDMRAARR